MSDLYVAMVFVAFIALGTTAPFVATLGYVWTDTFYPQLLSTIVALVPSSMIMGGSALLFYFMIDRRSPAQFTAHTALTLIFGLWCTLTLLWAEVPVAAWEKWNWAFKTVMFSAFIPMVIRSRVQIEAFVQVYLAAMLIHIIPVGTKTLISGSSYGRSLGLLRGNIGVAESSTLSAICVALIPVMLYLRRHSILLPASKLRNLAYLSLIVVALGAAVGTYARTALVGFAVVGISLFITSKKKALYILFVLLLAVGIGGYTATSWGDRIATTVDYENESSAYGRILVWIWTIDYVTAHPFGGAFKNELINLITITDGATTYVHRGKAYHNMYFEVLGEQGFPGLFMFVALQLISITYLARVIRRTRGKEHLVWLGDLARALLTALLTVMACGFFIGIAYQAFVWYLIALPVCLYAYMIRVEMLESGNAEAVSAGFLIPGKATTTAGLTVR